MEMFHKKKKIYCTCFKAINIFTLYRRECSLGPPGIPHSGSASHGRTGPWPASVPTEFIIFIESLSTQISKGL
jgi:hypothetical protein